MSRELGQYPYSGLVGATILGGIRIIAYFFYCNMTFVLLGFVDKRQLLFLNRRQYYIAKISYYLSTDGVDNAKSYKFMTMSVQVF